MVWFWSHVAQDPLLFYNWCLYINRIEPVRTELEGMLLLDVACMALCAHMMMWTAPINDLVAMTIARMVNPRSQALDLNILVAVVAWPD